MQQGDAVDVRALEGRSTHGPTAVVDLLDEDDGSVIGRADFQGPDVDGVTIVHVPEGAPAPQVGDLVPAVVVGTEGIDLVAEPR